ncbi:hypothetical protein EsH8_I_000724 [Colletotrichum jinshuiense]
MSYQYPPPLPLHGSEMDVSHPDYVTNYIAPAPEPPLMDPRTHDPTLEERGESFSQADLSDASQQLILAGDKKRNKLGYHRTSVACGHCRRRKIRCIPSPVDVQGRCINCIRLKKECSFHPVDQPPPPQMADARSKAPSRASVGSKIASESSSPAMAPGQSPEMLHRQQYHPSVIPSAPNMAPPAMRPPTIENIGPEAMMTSGAASASRAYDFPNQSITNWMSPNVSPGTAARPADLNETWKSYTQESPVTPSFSAYTPQAPSPASWSNAGSNAHDDIRWSSFAPGSSMTYPRGTQLPSQYPAMPQQSRQFGRKSSTMSADTYPAQIATAFPGVDPQNASLSAGAVPPSGYGSWQQPYPYTKSTEGYEDWNYDGSGGN